MSIETIEQDLRRKVSPKIRVSGEGIDRFRVFTPFLFDDGDHLVIVLKKEGTRWVLSDEAHTYMHLTYDIEEKDLHRGARQKTIANALSRFGIDDQEGELVLEVPEERYGDALYSFVQGLLKITGVSLLSRERDVSTIPAQPRSVADGIQETDHMDEEPEGRIAEIEGAAQDVGAEALIDLLSGAAIRSTPKNRLVQKVLRQLIETYGFDRSTIRTGYRPTAKGKRTASVDIVIFRHGQEPTDDSVERAIVCQTQKPREKLRSPQEAAADLRKLEKKLELLPNCHMGMWTNGHEEFFVRVEETRFQTRYIDIGAWPAPGERTDDVLREGGATQVGADPDDLEATLGRCHQYLTKNLALGTDAFKPLGALLLAKLFDETQPDENRRFWIRGEEPFDADGQNAIRERVAACFEDARVWQPDVLLHGWDLGYLDAAQMAPLVTELARYSLADSLPRSRTTAFRSGARSTMDGREGRYPTPLNVADMAVAMLAPGPDERVFDGSCGTGTFLATTAVYMFERFLAEAGTRPDTATRNDLQVAQARTTQWATDHVFGCDMNPALVASARLNLLLTAGHPGNIYRIDARTFPDGVLEDQERAHAAAPLGSMDIVVTNPWFSSKETIDDGAILDRYDLGHVWTRNEDGHFVKTGAIKTGGVPPEVMFLERAWQWAKPGTGRIAILLPNGLLGKSSGEYIRWWILRHCEVLASVDLPAEPFKVTLKGYILTPALPSLLVLRRRSDEELMRVDHPGYWVFMAVADRAGVDARGNLLFERSPDGAELIFDDEVFERVRRGGNVRSQKVPRRQYHVDDELPTVAQRYRAFIDGGRKGP